MLFNQFYDPSIRIMTIIWIVKLQKFNNLVLAVKGLNIRKIKI